jgi:hypothetical protein
MLLPVNSMKTMWLVYALGCAVFFSTKKIDLSTEVGDNGHLKWNWIPPFSSLWSVAWLIMLITPMWLTGRVTAVAFNICTYLVSAYFNGKYGTAGSYWCWIAISTWLISFIKVLR